MRKAQTILQNTFPETNWTLEKPKDGLRKECYIAKSSNKYLFIKFDVPVNLLKRLGEIGVAPRVLFDGNFNGISYVIQEFIDGQYPDRKWIKQNLSKLADLIKTYHGDQTLKSFLSQKNTTDFTNHIEKNLKEIEEKVYLLKDEELISDFGKLKEISKKLISTSLVPVHTEPNIKNILVGKNRFVIIDWDEITLSDPVRDIGLLLWWYVPKTQWQDFFDSYGMVISEDIKDNIYWWAAKSSLAIALWNLERGYEYKSFLLDFRAALDKKDNPHATRN
ncbi:MAG: phosphotransferase [Candidatus Gottesmanbacteria bacterium]